MSKDLKLGTKSHISSQEDLFFLQLERKLIENFKKKMSQNSQANSGSNVVQLAANPNASQAPLKKAA